MKFLVIFFLLINTFTSGAQAPKINDSAVDMLINKVITKTISPEEKKELKTKAFELQNYGQNLDEVYHDYKKSVQYTSKAIMLFNLLNDTLNVANNLKFRGYLLGRLGNFSEAKSDIRLAIQLFQLRNAAWGVAVSQFDLSRVYDFENKLDSAVYFSSTPLVYWKSVKNNTRIIILQTMLTHLFTKLKEFDKAEFHQKEAEKLITEPRLHWQNIIDFYFVSEALFRKLNLLTTANHYKHLYNSKRNELKQDGISARSYYDMNLQ
jgi:tetratricopeptide (TPR) repeat protein